MKIAAILSALFLSLNAFAVEMREVTIWPGFSQKEQNANLGKCQKQLRELQICSINFFEHGHAVYDVVLMEAAAQPTKILSLYKGFSQADQISNEAFCKRIVRFKQLCVTNAWIHGAGFYDVALME